MNWNAVLPSVHRPSLLLELSIIVQKAVILVKPGEAQRLRFYYIGRRFYPVIPKPVLVIVDMPDFDFSYMSEEDQERCLNCFNFFLISPWWYI